MTTNKQTPLSEKRDDFLNMDYDKYLYYEKDVRDAVRRLKYDIIYLLKCEEGIVPAYDKKLEEIFGKELCEDNSQEKMKEVKEK